MKIVAPLLAAVLLAASLPAQTVELDPPLIVSTPPAWTVEFNGDKGLAFYVVKKPGGGMALLMFSRMPIPLTKDAIPGYLTDMVSRFLKKVKGSPMVKLESDAYVRETITGTEFAGESASFAIGSGLIQTMFLIGNGEGIWSGQFTGTKEGWTEALEILKTLKAR